MNTDIKTLLNIAGVDTNSGKAKQLVEAATFPKDADAGEVKKLKYAIKIQMGKFVHDFVHKHTKGGSADPMDLDWPSDNDMLDSFASDVGVGKSINKLIDLIGEDAANKFERDTLHSFEVG